LAGEGLEWALAEVAAAGGLEVVRNSCFKELGFLSAPQPAMLTFVADEKYLPVARRFADKISCVITTPKLAERLGEVGGLALAPDPRRSFYAVHNHLALRTEFYGCAYPSHVEPSAHVHRTAYVDEQNVRIEADAVIGPNTTILEGSTIGKGVRIQAASVVGATAFQSIREEPIADMVHAGRIEVGEDAVLLAGCVVARGVFRQETRIGAGAHIGSLVFISHNVQIGRRSFIGHGSTIAGNVSIGADVWIGPGSTISNNVRIDDRAKVSLGSTVVRDIAADQHVRGNFAIDHRRFLRHMAGWR